MRVQFSSSLALACTAAVLATAVVPADIAQSLQGDDANGDEEGQSASTDKIEATDSESYSMSLCSIILMNIATSIGAMTGRLTDSFHAVFDPMITDMPEKLLLFIVWDFTDAAVRFLEESYETACEILACGSCSQPRVYRSNAFPTPSFTDSFGQLVARLRLFAELVEGVRMRQPPSRFAGVMLSTREEFGASNVLIQEKWAAVERELRDFTEVDTPVTIIDHHPQGKILTELEQGLQGIVPGNVDAAGEWVSDLLAVLKPVQRNVTAAARLASAVLLEYRSTPMLSNSFNVSIYRAYVEDAELFRDLLSFIQNFAHGTAKSELLFSRTHPLCGLRSFRLHGHHPAAATTESGSSTGKAYASARNQAFRDVSGFLTWRSLQPKTLMEHIVAAGHPASKTFWAARSPDHERISCDRSAGLLFDPTRCLEEDAAAGWAGYVYLVDHAHGEQNLTEAHFLPRPWRGQRMTGSAWEVSNVVSPPDPLDVVTLSPLVGNCHLLVEMLTAESMTVSKLVYAPFNPTLPPPLLARPNFTEFARMFWKRYHKNPSVVDVTVQSRQFTLAQCSLSAIAEDLAPLSYVLLQVQHQYAVFVHRAVAPVFGLSATDAAQRFEEWRLGWFCSPLSRYIFGIESASDFEFDDVSPHPSVPEAAERAVCSFLKHQALDSQSVWLAHRCDKVSRQDTSSLTEPLPGRLKRSVARMQRTLWAREQNRPAPGQSHLLRRSKRATCHQSPTGVEVCDCFVPFRGPMCRSSDRSDADATRPYSGAVHYIVNDGEEHVSELLYGLENLYEMFNTQFDYPVLVFHDGLSQRTRERIVLAAPHRLWFFLVHDWAPSESHLAQETHGGKFGIGYRAQSRFRSGPIFSHPATQGFDYLWGLDSDSHFPAPVVRDPFEHLHSNQDLVMGYYYITTTSPSSVRGLWEHTMLYAVREGIDIWDSALSTNWRIGKTHFLTLFLVGAMKGYEGIPQWNNRVVMTDCEILRLSFFREGSRYWDYYSFLDSVEGFWSHRWGDHAVRTLGAALALWEEDRASWAGGHVGRGSDGWPRTFEMDHPYAHQDYCSCKGPLDDNPGEGCAVFHYPPMGITSKRLGKIRHKYWHCVL